NAKPRHVHQIARQRSVICHSREHISTALKSFTTLHLMLCIALGDVRLGCSCSAMETYSMNLCCCANLKATQSLEVFSYWLCKQLVTSAHCALQHALTLLCHFTWPTNSWLSFCSSQLLTLCYNTTNS
ncbi:unnamed protein product, partial [Staurois parvus]